MVWRYAASGWTTATPDADAASRTISQASHDLELRLAGVPGAFVENKIYTLTTHFRQTPPYYHDLVASTFDDIAHPLVQSGSCHVTEAKMALELRPSIDWNKGRSPDVDPIPVVA